MYTVTYASILNLAIRIQELLHVLSWSETVNMQIRTHHA